MKEIIVYNKRMFDDLMLINNISDDNVEDRSTIMFISITDTDKFDESRIPYFKSNHSNVLNLSFDDCENDGDPSPTQYIGTKSFSEEQAKEVYDFIKNNEDKETFIIHCMAGISRSGGVGLFINDYFNQDYNVFMNKNPYVRPNAKVSRLLNNLHRNER